MVAIELQNVQLEAFHGIYEGEQKVGNMFEINLQVFYEEETMQFNDLDETINYVDLFDIVKQRMQVPTPLLEEVCASIIRRIHHQYPLISEVKISLHKLAAPIENFQGKVGVMMHRKFEN